jgi:hypothetical protein
MLSVDVSCTVLIVAMLWQNPNIRVPTASQRICSFQLYGPETGSDGKGTIYISKLINERMPDEDIYIKVSPPFVPPLSYPLLFHSLSNVLNLSSLWYSSVDVR